MPIEAFSDGSEYLVHVRICCAGNDSGRMAARRVEEWPASAKYHSMDHRSPLPLRSLPRRGQTEFNGKLVAIALLELHAVLTWRPVSNQESVGGSYMSILRYEGIEVGDVPHHIVMISPLRSMRITITAGSLCKKLEMPHTPQSGVRRLRHRSVLPLPFSEADHSPEPTLVIYSA